MTPTDPPARPASRTRPIAAAILGLEAVVMLAMASVVLVDAGSHPELPRRLTLGLAAFIGVFAVAVGAAAVSVLRRGRFGVGFGITWQLFQALVSASMLRAALYLPGAFGLISAVAAFVLLMDLARRTPTPLEHD